MGSGTIALSDGQLEINSNITINGPGTRVLSVSGNNVSRVFLVNQSTNATIGGLKISNGNTGSTEGGGGVYNRGTLTMTNSTVSGNTAALTDGGGIGNAGTLTLSNSTVSGNAATDTSSSNGLGGGIMNFGTLTITNSTVSGNTAKGGGGIFNHKGSLTLRNATVSANTLTTSEVFNHHGVGGGINNYDVGQVMLSNTIIAGNSAVSAPDVAGNSVTSQGNNLIGNTTGASGFVASDLKNVNPLLGPLQDNGGPTPTHALLPGSPAVDAGKETTCLPKDQRGVLRKDGDENGSVICDIGAFERNDLTPPRVTATTPTAGKMGVARNTNLTATFSERMDRTTLTKSTFKLYRVASNGTTTQVTNVVVGSTPDGLKAALNPFGKSATVLAADTRYRAVVTTGAKDRAGNRLDQNRNARGNQPMVWTFTTGGSS